MKMRWPFERFDGAVCKASLKMAISRGNHYSRYFLTNLYRNISPVLHADSSLLIYANTSLSATTEIIRIIPYGEKYYYLGQG